MANDTRTKKWFSLFIEEIEANKHYLSELDSAIGDGDHGNNMARGTTALKEKLETEEELEISELFKLAGMTFVSKIGGASGPLYGSAFINMAKTSKETTSTLDLLKSGLEGIKKRGKAEINEKTMVDVWTPVIEAYEKGHLTSEKVQQFVVATKDMKATKGRASYLGERSIGHIDPGACSSGYLFSSMIKAGILDE